MRLGDGERQLLRIAAILAIVFLGIQVFAFLWAAVGAVSDVLLVFVAAWALSYLLAPLVNRIDDRTPLDRTLSVVIVYIGIAVVLALVVALVVPPLSAQLTDLVARAPEYGDRAAQAVLDTEARLRDMGIRVSLAEMYGTLPQRIGEIAGSYAADILGVVSATAGAFFNVTLVLIIAFLMLIDGDRLWRAFVDRLPTEFQRDAEILRESTDRSFGGFIRGSLILGTIYGVATLVMLVAFGVPFFGVLAVVSGLTVIIPFFGPIIAMVPVLAVTAVGAGDRFLWVLGATLLLQNIALNVVGPRVMAKSIGIHPIFVFFALLLGGRVAGFWGLVLAMPVAGIIATVSEYALRRVEHERAKEALVEAS